MKAILLGAIGVVAMLMWLRDETPRRAPAPAPAPQAKVAPPKAVPPVKLAASRPKPQPRAVKVIPPVEEKAPEFVPVAAAAPAPAPRNEPPKNEPPADPDSVFGWGPWTGGGPGIAQGGAPAPGANLPPRVDGLTASLTPASSPGAPAGAAPPTVVPPAQNTSSIRPGHGWGDRNHVHVHKHSHR